MHEDVGTGRATRAAPLTVKQLCGELNPAGRSQRDDDLADVLF